MNAPGAPLATRHRAAAVVVLVRGAAHLLETFWVKRADTLSFMPGFRAFIGGSVDAEDAELVVEGAEGTDALERACAIRETFEEAGVLIGVANPGTLEQLAEARTRLLVGEASFVQLAREHGWRFRADALTCVGRWITPPFAPVRFESPYFLARMPAGQHADIRVGELVEGDWITPVEALGRWQRGDETFAAPILYTLVALAHGDAGIEELIAESAETMERPVQRIELKWGIVMVPQLTRPLPPATHTNAYLIGEPEMALVDPGSDDPESLRQLFAVIDALVQDRRKLKLVVLTHHHPDHIAGLAAVRQRFKVPVFAHAETARHLKVDALVKDSEVIPLLPGVGGDWNLEVLHTPGHTRGHISLFHRRTGSLLTGDHIPGGKGTVIIDPPEGDMGDYLRSLERLRALPVTTLFPGHGGPHGAAQLRIRQLIEHRLERERKVFASLEALTQDSGATLSELVEVAYADTPRELWSYAERSLLAHLLKLEQDGRARHADDQWRLAAAQVPAPAKLVEDSPASARATRRRK
ncbi:MAG: MBL fold metallo-hydrolase [Candidatus Eisenbacteria bacterium]|uniref:MBL fold metallo-hydrolase n=1 Tax=Eiseniibacteriota bacterium TaxID=2212470 RepID=A0A849SJT2_UNCEI|nr:MBL fold metallo-hydrolase [Candidatus Eisenbacteria bacterium]